MATYQNFYHGTDSAEYIESEGFKGSELSDRTSGDHVDGGVVFLSETEEYAARYGDTVFEITIEEGDAEFFGVDMVDSDEKEYTVSADRVNELGLYRIVSGGSEF